MTIHLPVLAEDTTRPFMAPSAGSVQHYEDVNSYMANLLRPQDALVAYWDGKKGDKPVGTENMIQIAQGKAARCYVLNEGLENTASGYDPQRYAYT